MALYHDGSKILSTLSQQSGSLKSRVFGAKTLKSPPTQLYALLSEATKWSPIIKEVVENSEILEQESKVGLLPSSRLGKVLTDRKAIIL